MLQLPVTLLLEHLDFHNKAYFFFLCVTLGNMEPTPTLLRLSVNTSRVPPLSPPYPYSTAQLVLIAMVTTSLSILTVLGNTLVILSIKVNRHLQMVNNYFLLSLAVADLIIGLFSMNVYTLYKLQGRWLLGPVLCDAWLVLDYVASSASVLNLLLISLDRYFCLTRPLSYPVRRTGRMACLMIAAAWLLSFILWPLNLEARITELETRLRTLHSPVASQAPVAGAAEDSVGPASCSLADPKQLGKEGGWVTVRRNIVLNRSPRYTTNPFMCLTVFPHSATHPPGVACLSPQKHPSQTAVKPTGDEDHNKTESEDSFNADLHRAASAVFSSCPDISSHERRRQRVMARERRVTRTILAIILVFVLTWTPYNVMAVVAAFCHCRIPDALWTTGYWLCYVNSTVNPGCYALCNVTFRKTFCSLLRCRCRRL
uniref:Muscarinic acetylcholine receptor n=1 Tax=Maylandia zebra TaxID=106582 RepID=A0A3P9B0P1_9CICH